MTRRRVTAMGAFGAMTLAVMLGLPSEAAAQARVDTGGGRTSYPAPDWMEALLPDPNDPRVQAYYAAERVRRAKQLEMQRFRREYFGSNRDVERRQVGLVLMRERYNQPDLYPLLLDVFEHDREDARVGILDMLADSRTDEADATLAWQAVFDDEEDIRTAARDRLVARVGETGEVSERIKTVVAGGLQKESNSAVLAAAGIAETLSIYEMVPLMISAQIAGGGGQNGRTGPLAWILIATQQAFVSDLQPVVSDSAVGFDPTLSVVTEGVVLEINGASVVTYRTEVFYSLARMTSAATGTNTASFGMDQGKWWDWYEAEWKPWMAAQAAEPVGG